jgi:hypothetical protein
MQAQHDLARDEPTRRDLAQHDAGGATTRDGADLGRPVRPADAAARLRYMTDVRQRTRRQVLAPSATLVVVGGLVLTRGVAAERWPRDAAISAGLLGLLVAVRLGLRAWRRRGEPSRWIGTTPIRTRQICAGAGAVGIAVAVAVGANPLITMIAAMTGVAAYLGGLAWLASGIVAIGLTGDVLVLDGAPAWAGLTIAGLGLLTLGLVSRRVERARA